MPTGLVDGAVLAPTDAPGFGAAQWDMMGGGAVVGRAMVGGPDFDPSGINNDTGFNRIVTGPDGVGPPIPGHHAGRIGDWRDLLDWQHSPTPWILLFALAAVGFIHARVNLHAGPAHFNTGLGA